MLTRKSPSWAKSKGLLILPVLSISLLCFSKNAFSDRKVEGNKVTYKGNVFEYYGPPEEIVVESDPSTGKKEKTSFHVDPYPVKMNGEKLLTSDEVDRRPQAIDSADNLLLPALYKLKPLFDKLDDGTYEVIIKDIVIGKKGELLLYTFNGLETIMHKQDPVTKKWGSLPIKPENIKNELNERIDAIARNMVFEPGNKNGQPVDCYASMAMGDFIVIDVKNHQAMIQTFINYVSQKKAAESGKGMLMFSK